MSSPSRRNRAPASGDSRQLELDFFSPPASSDPAGAAPGIDSAAWPPLREIVLELPVSEAAEGFDAWQAENRQRMAEFQQRWGLPVGARVRVLLDRGDRDAEELEGKLVPDAAAPPRPDGVCLRIGTRSFHSSRIMSAVRLD